MRWRLSSSFCLFSARAFVLSPATNTRRQHRCAATPRIDEAPRSLSPLGIEVEAAVNQCLRGENHAIADLTRGAAWRSPGAWFADSLVDALNSSGTFFEYPVFRVMEAREDRVRWMFSGTWPVPWRPRARIVGSSKITPNVIEDSWDASPLAIFFSQIWPRFWDIWNFFVAPPSEIAFEQTLRRFPGGIRLVKVPSYPSLRASLIDDTNSRSMRVASAVPFFPFGAKFDARNASTHYAVSPLEVEIDIVQTEPTVRRKVSWDVPLPSRFPDIDALPDLDPHSDTSYVDNGWASDPDLAYVNRGDRFLLLKDYDGDTQDPEAEQLRRALVDAARDAGLHPLGGDRPPAIHRQRNVKLVFDGNAQLCLAAYYVNFLPIPHNHLAIAVQPPPHDSKHLSH